MPGAPRHTRRRSDRRTLPAGPLRQSLVAAQSAYPPKLAVIADIQDRQVRANNCREQAQQTAAAVAAGRTGRPHQAGRRMLVGERSKREYLVY
jgi:tetraacyldisaccharide-1-P 4'-kinase